MEKERDVILTTIEGKIGVLSQRFGISQEVFRKKLEKREGEEFTLGQLRQIARECRLSLGEVADIFLT